MPIAETPGVRRAQAWRKEIERIFAPNPKQGMRVPGVVYPPELTGVGTPELRQLLADHRGAESVTEEELSDFLLAAARSIDRSLFSDPDALKEEKALAYGGCAWLFAPAPTQDDFDRLRSPTSQRAATTSSRRQINALSMRQVWAYSHYRKALTGSKQLESGSPRSGGNRRTEFRDALIRAVLQHLDVTDVAEAPDSVDAIFLIDAGRGTSEGVFSAFGGDELGMLSPKTVDPIESDESISGRPHRRQRKPWILVGLAVVVIVGSITTATLLGQRAERSSQDLAAGADAQMVEIKNVTGKPRFVDESFWIPASAPLDTLPLADLYCDNDEIRQWLTEHASMQHLPQQVTIRNVSGSSDLIAISDVTAHGVASTEVTPGFVFFCPTGGGGGPIEWSELKLQLADGEVALLRDNPSPYFWRSIDQAENAGLQIVLAGEQDFKGTLTAAITQGIGEPVATDLPVVIDWHGIPSDKFLEVRPGGYGNGGYGCSRTQTGLDTQPCGLDDIKNQLRAIWGTEAVR